MACDRARPEERRYHCCCRYAAATAAVVAVAATSATVVMVAAVTATSVAAAVVWSSLYAVASSLYALRQGSRTRTGNGSWGTVAVTDRGRRRRISSRACVGACVAVHDAGNEILWQRLLLLARPAAPPTAAACAAEPAKP